MATGARFTVLWETPRDPEEFDRHYREVHVPLTRKLPGLRRYTLSRDAMAIRGGELYYMVAELDFDDMAALHTAFGSPEGQAAAADVNLPAGNCGVHSMIYELDDEL